MQGSSRCGSPLPPFSEPPMQWRHACVLHHFSLSALSHTATRTHNAMDTNTTAKQLAALIAAAERPAPFTLPRDGRGLRLVPASERLSQAQLTSSMEQYLLAATTPASLVGTLQQPATVAPAKATGARARRHVAAWARGCCYLQAGNRRQALQDARAALAFCAAGGPPSAAPPSWFPASLLAGQAYAGLGEWSQAVVHLAQARAAAPDAGAASAASAQLAGAVRQLPADQLLAWSARGLPGLLQALQDEAEMRLPEALRPRPKWYYYHTWTTQRIHLALLELQLASSQGLLCSAGATSTSSSRGRLLLDLLAGGTDEAPAVAAAAAAAGFGATGDAAAAAAEAAVGAGDCPQDASGAVGQLPLLPVEQPPQPQLPGSLQLAQPVVDKLLAMDAGDLDLLIQHPVALQAQAYELLDVLQASGPEALASYALPQLSWQEVQALTGPGTVGLPLGYSAAGGLTLPPPPPPAQLPPATSASPADGVVSLAGSSTGWRRPGWTRAQYIAAAAGASGAAAGAAE